jgi:hypothetical protein
MKKLFCFLLILLLLLVACRDDGDETDSVVADVTPAEAVANEAPATATPPPAPTEAPEPTQAPAMINSAGEMVGIWLRTLAGERDYIMYTADGRYLVALSQDNLATAPRVSGEYWFEDGLIHLRDLENAGYWTECDSETVGIYGVVDLGDDQMQFQMVDDGCGDSGFTRGYSFGNAKQKWIAEPVE